MILECVCVYLLCYKVNENVTSTKIIICADRELAFEIPHCHKEDDGCIFDLLWTTSNGIDRNTHVPFQSCAHAPFQKASPKLPHLNLTPSFSKNI